MIYGLNKPLIPDWKNHIFQCISQLGMMDHKVNGRCLILGNHAPFFLVTGNLDIMKALDLCKRKLIVFMRPGYSFAASTQVIYSS